MIKRVTKKPAIQTNVLSSLGDSRSAASKFDDPSSGITSTLTVNDDPLFNQDLYTSITSVFGTEQGESRPSVDLPALATYQFMDEMIGKVPDQALNSSQPTFAPFPQLPAPQDNGEATSFSILAQHMADKSAGAIFAINEPKQDWLTGLEKLFDAPFYRHANQQGLCDSLHVKANHDHNHNCSQELSSSSVFLEPCPLIVVNAESVPTYLGVGDSTNEGAWSSP